MSNNHVIETLWFIAYGAGSYQQGEFYGGEKEQWKDMQIPERRPEINSYWSPNPDRLTYDEWLFDGHDADGGYWVTPLI